MSGFVYVMLVFCVVLVVLYFVFKGLHKKFMNLHNILEFNLSSMSQDVSDKKKEYEEEIEKLLEKKDEEIVMLTQIPISVFVKDNVQFVYEEIDDFKSLMTAIKELEQYHGDSTLGNAVRRCSDLMQVLDDFKLEIDKIILGGEE